MHVILSGRVAVVGRDGLRQAIPVAAFAQLIGAPVEEMAEAEPGEVLAELGQLSGTPSMVDARAVGEVQAMPFKMIEPMNPAERRSGHPARRLPKCIGRALRGCSTPSGKASPRACRRASSRR